MSEKLYIVDFETVESAIDFAKELNPKSTAWELVYEENEGDEPWICVLGKCDICGYTIIFFAPAIIYEDGISGVECSECGNMSIYPTERNDEQ